MSPTRLRSDWPVSSETVRIPRRPRACFARGAVGRRRGEDSGATEARGDDSPAPRGEVIAQRLDHLVDPRGRILDPNSQSRSIAARSPRARRGLSRRPLNGIQEVDGSIPFSSTNRSLLSPRREPPRSVLRETPRAATGRFPRLPRVSRCCPSYPKLLKRATRPASLMAYVKRPPKILFARIAQARGCRDLAATAADTRRRPGT